MLSRRRSRLNRFFERERENSVSLSCCSHFTFTCVFVSTRVRVSVRGTHALLHYWNVPGMAYGTLRSATFHKEVVTMRSALTRAMCVNGWVLCVRVCVLLRVIAGGI